MQATHDLPLFDPSPSCGKTASDLSYVVLGPTPTWLSLDGPQALIESSDEALAGTETQVPILASLDGSLMQEFSLTVTFAPLNDTATVEATNVTASEGQADDKLTVSELEAFMKKFFV